MFKSSYNWILVSQSFEFCCKTLKSNKLSTLWESFRAKSLSWPDQMYPVLSVVPSLPCTLFLETRCFPCFDHVRTTGKPRTYGHEPRCFINSVHQPNFIVLLMKISCLVQSEHKAWSHCFDALNSFILFILYNTATLFLPP